MYEIFVVEIASSSWVVVATVIRRYTLLSFWSNAYNGVDGVHTLPLFYKICLRCNWQIYGKNTWLLPLKHVVSWKIGTKVCELMHWNKSLIKDFQIFQKKNCNKILMIILFILRKRSCISIFVFVQLIFCISYKSVIIRITF